MEIFVSGDDGQRDALLTYKNQRLINIAQDKGLTNETATYGATAIDLDNDGDIDLIVACDDGVFIYVNQEGKIKSRCCYLDVYESSVFMRKRRRVCFAS